MNARPSSLVDKGGEANPGGGGVAMYGCTKTGAYKNKNKSQNCADSGNEDEDQRQGSVM